MLLVLLMDAAPESSDFLEKHSASLMLLVMTVMGLATLLALVPRLLRARQHKMEMQHTERMKALELGQTPPHPDERSISAGRTASLVPMVVICTAGAVTCFMAAYKFEGFFAVSMAVWSVAGAVSLAAITGGIALMGRLAQLHAGVEDEPEEEMEAEQESSGRE